jgi:hypothetical protein
MSRRSAVSALLFAALLGSGCAGSVRIRSLLDDPGHYDGKTVTTSGTVKSAAGLLGYATYQLSDGTGNLTVVTTSGGAPRDGTRVEVKGTFRSAFTLGTRTLAVLEERDRKPLGP